MSRPSTYTPEGYLHRLMTLPAIVNVRMRPEAALSAAVRRRMGEHIMAGRYKGVCNIFNNGIGKSRIGTLVLRLMGMINGFPDWGFMWSNADGTQGNALIELKVGNGTLSAEQKDTRNWIVNAGIPWTIARSVEEVEAFLKEQGAL